MGVTSSSLFRAVTCSRRLPPPPAERPRSARSYASAEEEATSTIIAEYESTHPVPPRPDPRALRRDVRRADALRRIRARLVQSVPGRRSRARYMERYFARRCGDDVALYVGGFGEGPPTFIEPRLNGDFHADALAPHVPGTPLAHRLVSLDHLPAGATGPDLRDVALGRHDPTRSETSGRRNAGGLVPGFGDGLTDLGGGGFGDSDGDSDDAFLYGASSASFGDGFDPASFTRRSEPPPPKTLARRRLDFDGAVARYPEGRGVGRWRAYCAEEEEKIADLAAFALAERDAKTAMMRRHYAATLGPGFEDRYEPPPLPRWLRDVRAEDFEAVKRHAPWRAAKEAAVSSSDASDSDGGSGDENASVSSTRRASPDSETRAVARRNREKRRGVLGMDDRSRSAVVSWRASADLRRRVVDRRLARAEAADKRWGEGRGFDIAEAGDGVLFLGEGAARHPENPVRFLDAGRHALATDPEYRRARERGGLEPDRAVARALKERRERNRAVRELHAVRDAERAKARRRVERRRVKTENKRRAAAESARVRLAAERAAAAAAAAAAAEARSARRWRRVRAVGNFVRRKALGTGREGEPAGEHEREAKRGPHEST